MHMKWNMLWLFATFTFSPIHTARISIIDSLSNTTFTLHTFHLWDRPDGQSRGLKLGAKQTPLRIYYQAVSTMFLYALHQIDTHDLVCARPDQYPTTTSTLMRILSSQQGGGGVQGGLRKLHLPDTFPDDDTCRTEKIPPLCNDISKHIQCLTQRHSGVLTAPNIPHLSRLSGVIQRLFNYSLPTSYTSLRMISRDHFPPGNGTPSPGSSLVTRY